MSGIRRLIASLGLALLPLPGLAPAAMATTSAPIPRIETGSHAAAVRAIASDRAGRVLLTASEDKTARLWRARDGKPLAVLRPSIDAGNEGKLYAAALSPDGELAAVAGWSADNDIFLFRARDGSLLARLSGQPNVVNRLAFSPDGGLLAVGLWGGHGIRLFRGQDGWRRASLAGEDGDYGGDTHGVAFSPDGDRLATAAHDGRLRLYALRAGAPWRQAETTLTAGRQAHALAFSPDGRQLAVGFADAPRVSVLRADDLTPAYSPDTRDLVAGGLGAIAWSRDGRHLYAAGSWRQAPGRNAIRQWRDGGAGRHRDVTVASDSILDLTALADGGIAYAAADASWGVLGAGGEITARAAAPRADPRANQEGFLIADDGGAVRFGYEFGGGRPATFDFASLTWRRTAPADQGLRPPVLRHPGLRVDDWRDSRAPSLNGRPLPLSAGETSLAMAIAHDGSAFALGTAWFVRLHGRDGRELWKTFTPSACFAVNLSADGRWLVAAFGDGSLRWYRRRDGVEMLAFFPHANGVDWVAWTPDGRYAASAEGDRLVGWHVDHGPDRAAEFLPVGRFAERYHDPAGIAAVLAPERAAPAAKLAAPTKPTPSPPPPPADLRRGFGLPPEVRIVAPGAGPVAGERLRVEVGARDRGAGIDELRLLLNGKVVASQITRRSGKASGKPARKAGDAETRASFEVSLEPGRNTLRLIAFGANRVESEPAEVIVEARPAPERPRLHVLAVGVNEYRNGVLNLDYSVPDARGVSEFFKAAPGGLFRDIAIHQIFDEQATRANILASLRRLRESRPEDAVVVYLAGHGETVRDDWYFVPHEVTAPEQPEALARGGLSSRDLAEELKSIPARKVVILIDACKSGAAASGFRGLQDRRALAQLSRATGTHLIAATTKEQMASELPTLGHGVFTYTLLQGLGGKAAAGGNDITARKLMVYVEQALPELTRRYRAEEQYPVVNSTGMDFPLALH